MPEKEKVYVQMPRDLSVWVNEEALRRYKSLRRRVTSSMVVEDAVSQYLDECPMTGEVEARTDEDAVMRGYYIAQDVMMRVRERKVAEEREFGRRSSIRSIIDAALRHASR